ncbi:PREDICTED: putative E3 ubiquitin-protein ligase UBR7 [Ceratosolen solmsi marchali]|uniref:E3 ubiquitin-protein ligase UBR7 n=1 Tax=Ceratosolen solmsi marchali TaxID=326594 RepID=A0AAJ6YCT9_9HYME|nr:PREDICTED: putative E3 ubiquitin-protein ligase UBR7 [Ceratosolen solmsi marchali]
MSSEKPTDKMLEDEENSVTMLDVLQEENDLEEDVNAVLGASDDQNCTYNKGYIRQALYACKTCCSKGTRAAICFACSLHCHEGHDLVELYTKRQVRCDCGNTKFGDKACGLESSKLPVNTDNKYNQNFDGVYCICARPYPDPDETESDEMIQCVICEDWYHSKHLGNGENLPNDNDYSEMICAGCMKSHEFLWRYAIKYSVSKSKKCQTNKEEKLDVVENKNGCILPESDFPKKEGSCFWIEGWRSSLCTCDKCKHVYEENAVDFLLDPLDSVQVYEEAGKVGKKETQYEKGMKALASLGHVQQLNAIEEYNNMKENLKQYLQKFVENKKVVREEDIKEFFSEMKSQKRPKVVVPTFCR